MRQVSRTQLEKKNGRFKRARQGEGKLSKSHLECFTKYKWFFQSECNTCSVSEECISETELHRERLIQRIEDQIKLEKKILSVYSELNPKLLNHKYDFLD